MVSDEDLKQRVWEKLGTADLQTMTERQLRKQLEDELGEDLSGRKALIKATIAQYLEERDKAEDSEPTVAQEGSEPDADAGDGDVDEEPDEENDEGDTKKKGGGGGLASRLCKLSPQLAGIVGADEMPRTQVVKQMWVYIKEHNLQEETDKRKIMCDARLKDLFGVDGTDMFQINKLLAPHILSPGGTAVGPDGQPLPKRPRPAKTKEEKAEAKRRRLNGEKAQTGFTKPLPISPELSQFFGGGETLMARHDVVKRLWAYIKSNNLQDPKNKKMILCDDKLKELLRVDSFMGFGMAKHLKPHFLQKTDDEPDA